MGVSRHSCRKSPKIHIIKMCVKLETKCTCHANQHIIDFKINKHRQNQLPSVLQYFDLSGAVGC